MRMWGLFVAWAMRVVFRLDALLGLGIGLSTEDFFVLFSFFGSKPYILYWVEEIYI